MDFFLPPLPAPSNLGQTYSNRNSVKLEDWYRLSRESHPFIPQISILFICLSDVQSKRDPFFLKFNSDADVALLFDS